VAYRFEIGYTFTGCLPGLRAQQTLFLEDEAGADEDTTGYGEDDADDLECGYEGNPREERDRKVPSSY